ncbi:hypothetical protein V8J82_18160 [Gymnodinialimonas sp. 2305UL16-5]|uniref:thermonuclease family protein n=1 Tax=Gymnodinialimonas mytili TaxID=3126503 RepID=UPI0030A7D09C
MRAFFGFWFAVALASTAQAVTAQVHIRDGDTIVVERTPVRLNGVDAPELGTAAGRDARRWMVNYLSDRSVRRDLNGERTRDR